MKSSLPFNGSDQLMRSFDYELRRHGFAGNQCQIILELAAPIARNSLRDRVWSLQKDYPIISARIGGIFKPRWKTNRDRKSVV